MLNTILAAIYILVVHVVHENNVLAGNFTGNFFANSDLICCLFLQIVI